MCQEGDQEEGHQGPPGEGAEADPRLPWWAAGGSHQIQRTVGGGATLGIPGSAQAAGGGVCPEEGEHPDQVAKVGHWNLNEYKQKKQWGDSGSSSGGGQRRPGRPCGLGWRRCGGSRSRLSPCHSSSPESASWRLNYTCTGGGLESWAHLKSLTCQIESFYLSRLQTFVKCLRMSTLTTLRSHCTCLHDSAHQQLELSGDSCGKTGEFLHVFSHR